MPPGIIASRELKDKHPTQYNFLTAPQKTIAMIGGRGSGKTWIGAERAFYAAYGYIGYSKVMKTPNTGIVTAPSQDMLWNAALDTFYERFGQYCIETGKRRTVLRNGSVILWRSVYLPDYLRGANVSWWWGDEASRYENNVRLIISPMLRQHGEVGYQWFTTTPRGRNWLWQLFERDKPTDTIYFNASSEDNPFLSPDYAKWLRKEYGETDFAQQEIQGKFIAYQGLVYYNFRRSDHEWREPLPKFSRVIVGVDWGFASPGVMLVIGLDWDNRAWVAEEFYLTHRTIEDWRGIAEQIVNRYDPEAFYCDPSEPKFVRELNLAPGVHAYAANNRVEPGLQAVLRRMARQQDGMPRLYVDRSCVNTLREFETYQRRPLQDGNFDDTVIKMNDHAMDALRYAIMGLDEPVGMATAGEIINWR